jgi:hypothetical protein
MKPVEIIPAESIGGLHVGARVADLPKRASLSGPGGKLDGIQFLASDGVIQDVWIDDLRKFPAEVHFRGKVIPPDASLDFLKKLFGPCEEVTGRKGGVFFNCASGVALLSDFRGAGTFVQIRLRRVPDAPRVPHVD